MNTKLLWRFILGLYLCLIPAIAQAKSPDYIEVKETAVELREPVESHRKAGWLLGLGISHYNLEKSIYTGLRPVGIMLGKRFKNEMYYVEYFKSSSSLPLQKYLILSEINGSQIKGRLIKPQLTGLAFGGEIFLGSSDIFFGFNAAFVTVKDDDHNVSISGTSLGLHLGLNKALTSRWSIKPYGGIALTSFNRGTIRGISRNMARPISAIDYVAGLKTEFVF